MHSVGTIPRRWSVADSRETYAVRQWGGKYFDINDAGHVIAHPAGPPGQQSQASSPSSPPQAPGAGSVPVAVNHAEGSAPPAAVNPMTYDHIDLKELVDEVRARGIGLPLLIRFPEILKARIVELNEAFRTAITEYGFRGTYKGVYPIKVNQDRFVVEQIAAYGRQYHYGLEAGSKPELLAVMALMEDEEALIICNGYKDEEYVESALLASKLGKTLIMVVEKFSELPLIASIAKRTGVRPRIGIRAKLSTRGAGRWEASGGDRSKFGLSSREMMEAMKFLRDNDLLDSFELLHFHLGSQISSIRSIKNAMREGGRFFVELVKAGAPLRYMDVGGGLGVDYDGSQTNFSSSMNYTLQEYANDVVFSLQELCDDAKIPHPIIVSESGRAVVAQHAILVVDVLGVSEFDAGKVPEELSPGAAPVVRHLWETFRDVTRKNFLEAYHDAIEYKDECMTLFALGHLSLEQRVIAEDIFWAICQRVLRLVREQAHVPEDLQGLERALSDTYFCNFSMFQSVPDSWAVDQLFPIMPIHRLNEEPSRVGVLADITCDSDGKIDQFIDRRDVKNVLELHPLTGEDYYIGIFMVGAYQEILGDLHNLFGDTNTVHVVCAAGGGYHIEHVVAGDTVTDVLKYVGHTREDLTTRIRRAAEVALRNRRMTLDETRQLLRIYEQGLSGYTYLERD